MGMSASQARLLSITGRLTNNEFQAQTITNSKLRLAEKSENASAEYMNALNSQELMYGVYSDNGEKIYTALTANTILSYGDLKNQYALVNSSGKILANSVDIKNYKSADTNMDAFLANYVGSTSNGSFYESLKDIYGENYGHYFTTFETRYNFYDKIINTNEGQNSFANFINKAVDNTNKGKLTLTDKSKDADGLYILNGSYDDWAASFNSCDTYTGMSFPISGDFGAWYMEISSFPKIDYPEKPIKPTQDQFKKQINSVSGIWDKFINAVNQGGCWDEANVAPQSGFHIEHILTHLLNPGETYKTSDGVEFTMKNDNDGHTSVGGQSDSNWKPEQEAAAKELREIISNNNKLENLQQLIIDTYYKSVVAYGNQSDLGITTPATEITFNKNVSDIAADNARVASAQSAYEGAAAILDVLKTTENGKNTAYEQAQQAYQQALEDYNAKVIIYNASIGTSLEASAQADMVNAETAKNNVETAQYNALTAYETARIERETYESGTYSTAQADYNAALAEQTKTEITVLRTDTASINARMMEATQNLLYEIKNSVVFEWVDDVDAFNSAMTFFYNQVADYNRTLEELENSLNKKLPGWSEKVEEKLSKYKQALDDLKENEMTKLDENDPKYQWYKNLWFRMGAGKSHNYTEIELNLLNNSEWLQFCFEHGVLTLEQAQFAEKGSDVYPEMGTFNWISKPYTNAADFISRQADVKIAVAEAKYKKTITEIENKDKKFDQDLKKLDTEHSALQTEYDSLKEVISKNTERSFKAFS